MSKANATPDTNVTGQTNGARRAARRVSVSPSPDADAGDPTVAVPAAPEQTIIALGRYTPERPPRAARLRRLGSRLKDAGVLDPEWYLECNRDVSEAALDPVRDYLLDGVREGREPRDVAPLLGEPERKEG